MYICMYVLSFIFVKGIYRKRAYLVAPKRAKDELGGIVFYFGIPLRSSLW